MPPAPDPRRYRENLAEEIDGAFLYRAMAAGERDERLAGIYRRLADVEDRHADFWEDLLRKAGERVGERKPSWQARTLALLARRFGPGLVLPFAVASEDEAQVMYDDQPETEGTSLRADERSHARILRTIAGSHSGGRGMEGGALARLEGRHRSVGGNALRAAVLGANDGLVSNLALVMGVAGAGLPRTSIVVTGLAGLLAGSSSMAMGEWISVQSAREQAERQLRIEEQEIAALPEEEREELRLIYEAKGLPEDEARRVADRLLADDSAALEVMAVEELGINPEDLGGSPWVAAIASFLLFAVGAVVPLLPYVFGSGRGAAVAAIVAAGVGLYALGAAITLFTGRSATVAGLRQLGIGWAAAAVTYGLGSLVGAGLG